jgi:hypothetical protein
MIQKKSVLIFLILISWISSSIALAENLSKNLSYTSSISGNGLNDSSNVFSFIDNIISISSKIILFSLLLIFFVLAIKLARLKEPMIILPFEIAQNTEGYSGKAISDLLYLNMIRISEATRDDTKLVDEKICEELFSSPSIAAIIVQENSDQGKDSKNEQKFKFETITPEIGTIDMGIASFSIGDILNIIRKLTKNEAKSIHGSLQKYGSEIFLISSLSSSDVVWDLREVSNNNYGEMIVKLVNDLSYRIYYDLYVCQTTKVFIRSWQSFKYYTDALGNFVKYTQTNNTKDLELSTKYWLLFNESENPFWLVEFFVLLGLKHKNIGDLTKAKELINLALEVGPANKFALSWKSLLSE